MLRRALAVLLLATFACQPGSRKTDDKGAADRGPAAPPSASVAAPSVQSEDSAAELRDARKFQRAEVLKLALISSTPAETVARYGAFIDWLARESGFSAGDLLVHDSPELMIGDLCNGTADLLLESMYPVAGAMVGCSARPLAVAAKGNAYRYTATIVVRKDSNVKVLADLGGRDILFEDDRSTSAYLVPRLLLEEAGLSVEPADQAARPEAVRYRFCRDEMNAVGWVVHGLSTAAAISDQDLADFPDAELRVLGKSAPLPRQMIAAAPSLPQNKLERVREALLRASSNPDAGKSLKRAKTAGFAPLTAEDLALLNSLRKFVAPRAAGKGS